LFETQGAFMRKAVAVVVLTMLASGCAYRLGMMGSPTVPIEARGPEVGGESCLISIFGITFGSGAFPDVAVQDAVDRANRREQRKPGELYNALADCEITETFTAYSHCFGARGVAVRVNTEGAQ
jgi:hypothetical protein